MNAGIIPFTFVNAEDYDKIDKNDKLCIPNIRNIILNGEKAILKNETKDQEYNIEYQLSSRQKEIICKGGLLNYTRELS